MTGCAPVSGIPTPVMPCLWLCDTSAVSDPVLLAQYRALLDSRERDRLERLRFAADRHVFLVSHALLRTTLAELTGMAPEALRLGRGPHGKPFLADAAGHEIPGFAFNLSHSGTHAVVICSKGAKALGVDLEFHRPGRPFTRLAKRYFSANEAHTLERLPESDRIAPFYDIWTLKEAYIKALGTGLRTPLGDFAFTFQPQGLRFDAEPGLESDPGRWRFWCARLAGGFSLSLAMERQDRAETLPEPQLVEVVPLVSAQPHRVDRVVAKSL